MKKIAILQPNYIPWKGYFDLINMVDEFVLYDEMQYTKRDWRNRNRIKTPSGLQWLTIPVRVKGNFFQKINQTQISDKNWGKKHWQTIQRNYAKAPFFNDYREIFEDLYLNCNDTYLSDVNYKFIQAINKILGIKTVIKWSSDFDLIDGKTERLLGICKACNATIYLSGPSAKTYFNQSLAEKENIQVKWMDYNNYPEYTQLHPPFRHNVTILDLIFNEGPNAAKYMKSLGR